jgi:hypothetical protein
MKRARQRRLVDAAARDAYISCVRDTRAGSHRLGLSVVFGVLLWTAAAGAQSEGPSISLKNNNEGIVRGASYEPNYLRLNQFNRQNCSDDETVVFNVDIFGPAAIVVPFHLEAWVGTGCEETASRSSGACTKVGAVGTSVERVVLSVRDLVRSTATSDAEPCASESEAAAANVYFMLLDNDGEPPPGSLWFLHWPYQYDLVPPTAPTTVRASPAAGGLHVSWEHPDAPADVRRYVFLCDPPPAADPADAIGPNQFCESPLLAAGEIPNLHQLSQFLCGYSEGDATSADVTPLTTDVTYAVAVVALDSYYNVSPLSDTACDVPDPAAEPSTTHTVITERGCAIGGERQGSLGALLVVGGLAALAVRRRVIHRRTRDGARGDAPDAHRGPREDPAPRWSRQTRW